MTPCIKCCSDGIFWPSVVHENAGRYQCADKSCQNYTLYYTGDNEAESKSLALAAWERMNKPKETDETR